MDQYGHGRDAHRTVPPTIPIRYGTPVLVTFTFGELDAVDAVGLLPRGLTSWVKRTFRMSTTFFAGRWGTFVPKRVPFNMVIAPPIAVRQFAVDDRAYAAEVDRVHAAYTAAVTSLFETNKTRFGYADRPLVFI